MDRAYFIQTELDEGPAMAATAEHQIESEAGDMNADAPMGEAFEATLLEARKVPGAEWDRLACEFDGIAQEQLHAFAHSRWPGVELEPVVFSIDNQIMGGCMVMIQPLPLGLGNIAVCKWGPVLKDAEWAGSEALYKQMIALLRAEYCVERRMLLSVLPRAMPAEENLHMKILDEMGFSRGSALKFPNRYIVNLRQSDEELTKSFAQKWRYHLKKSMKAELEFYRGEAQDLDKFDALYRAMTDRKKFADHSAYETISSLYETEVEAVKPELFFVDQGGETVAGAIIFKAGDTAVYLYGATNDRALGLRAGYFMHWHIIRWLRDNTHASWYDLGGTDGFQGLHQFKKGMVGKAGHIQPVPPVMNFASDPFARAVGLSAYGLREMTHNVRHMIERVRSDLATADQKRAE